MLSKTNFCLMPRLFLIFYILSWWPFSSDLAELIYPQDGKVTEMLRVSSPTPGENLDIEKKEKDDLIEEKVEEE